MNKTMDFREVKLNEIMNSTDLLEFEYTRSNGKFHFALNLFAILITSVAIISSLPLL